MLPSAAAVNRRDAYALNINYGDQQPKWHAKCAATLTVYVLRMLGKLHPLLLNICIRFQVMSADETRCLLTILTAKAGIYWCSHWLTHC